MLRLTLTLSLFLLTNPTAAHDRWANGDPIPPWIKAACCGPADAHHLRPDQVTRSDDFYYVEGYPSRIPVAKAIPSEDGDYWIFYSDHVGTGYTPSGPSSVYCFFVPMDF